MSMLFIGLWVITIFICTIYSRSYFLNKERKEQLKAKEKEIQDWKDTVVPESIENDKSLQVEAQIEFPLKFKKFLCHYMKACENLGITPTAQTSIIFSTLKNYPPYIQDSVSNSFKFIERKRIVEIEYTYISKITNKGYKYTFRVESLSYEDIPYPLYISRKYNHFAEL